MRLIPFAVPAVAVLLVAAYRRLHAQGIWPEATTLEQFGITERLAQGFYIWFYYLCKSVAPFNLSPVYTKLFWFNPFDWPFLLSTVAVVGLTGFLVYQRRRFPGACLVWVSYLILLVPFQGWFEHPHYSSDRYSLLPHIPLAIAVAFIVYRGLMSRWNTTVLSASAILLCITVLTLRQIPIWQNSRHLFHHILAHVGASPYRADISFRLATWEDAQGNRARAIQHYLETLAVAPHFVKGRLHLVMALIAEGRIEEAITHYKAGLQSDPNNVQMLNDLAWLRATQPNPAFRDGAEAVQLATRACELTRYQVPLCMGTLAASYAEAGRFEDAIATARKAAALARAEGQTNLVLKTEELIELYSARTAYRDTVE
jgi:Tfp pilus assembly protein PilF